MSDVRRASRLAARDAVSRLSGRKRGPTAGSSGREAPELSLWSAARTTWVATISGNALTVLDHAHAGTLVDSPLFGPSLYLHAHDSLAALGSRIPLEHATRLLAHLAPRAPGEVDTSRYTDDAHAAACAAIGATHTALLDVALDQLLAILARAPHALKGPARESLTENLDLVRNRLVALTKSGNRDAEEILAIAEPASVTPNKPRPPTDLSPPPSTTVQWFIDAGSVSYVESPISTRYLSQDDRIEIADRLARQEPVKAIAKTNLHAGSTW